MPVTAAADDRVRVWVDDRNPIFRHGISTVVSSDGFVVAGESAGLDPEPDLSAVEVLLFEADGKTLYKALRLANPKSARLVAVMTSPNEQLVGDAIEGEAAAIMLRAEMQPSTLLSCLRTVTQGHTALPSSLVPKLMGRAANGSNGGNGSLTPREIDVLGLLAAGEDTKEIAAALAYSERTVKNIVHDVLMKMNCRNRVQAVAQATRSGLI
jgi:DNA-binding NarL/FixJ family response regulator